MESPILLTRLEKALISRQGLLEETHSSALRLFNGFYEGLPDFTVDLYGHSLVFTVFSAQPWDLKEVIDTSLAFYQARLPWLKAALLKMRRPTDPAFSKGELIFGEQIDDQICENGIWYALDLRLNQDSSFYLDTRALRGWLRDTSSGMRVLNTFAYTGSLGVAALAGGASTVLQTDLNPRFLELARKSAALNRDLNGRHTLQSGDFFRVAGRLRSQNIQFDTVILDAPYFSKTQAGQVDLFQNSSRLINKLRPLVAQNGLLIAINNALFLSGSAYMDGLKELCADGYMEIERLIPVPQDFIGYAQDFPPHLPVDPAPFNHPTKIAVLRLTRRQP